MKIRKLAAALAITAAMVGGGTSATAQTPPPVIYTELPSLSCYAAGKYLHTYYFAMYATPDHLGYAVSALLVGASVWNKGCMSYDITASSHSGYSRAKGYPNASATFRVRYGIRDSFGYSPPYTIKVNVPSSWPPPNADRRHRARCARPCRTRGQPPPGGSHDPVATARR